VKEALSQKEPIRTNRPAASSFRGVHLSKTGELMASRLLNLKACLTFNLALTTLLMSFLEDARF